MIDPERYLRQIILAGVGEEGQRRLAQARAPLAGPSLAHEIARTYCERAGFEGVDEGPVDVDRLAPLELGLEPAAREVLAGSRAALAEIRRVVGGVRGGA